MHLLKSVLLNLGFFLLIDLIWLKFIMGGHFKRILEPIARMKEGEFDVRIGPALVVYLLMAIALDVFVLSRSLDRWPTVFHGALLGLVIYGIFDFTNYALLKNYPKDMLIIDVLWGAVLFGLVAYIRFLMKPKGLFI